jgi:hypothetical protein
MRWRRVLLGIGIVALVIVAGYAGWNALLAREYASRLDALRAAGEPVFHTDLRPPPVAEEENAAPLLEKAQNAGCPGCPISSPPSGPRCP